MAEQTRSPTADRTATGTWSGSAGSRYTLVDDYPDDTPNDVLNCSAAGYITFTFPAFTIPAGATSISVSVRYYDRVTSAGTAAAAARLDIGASSSYNATTHAPATTLTQRTDTWANNPRGGAPWTVTEVNGTAINYLRAVGFYLSDASPSVDFSSVQLVVTYTPANWTLTVNNASHGHTAESPTLSASFDLAPAAAAHTHQAESPTLSASFDLDPAAAFHAHQAESPVLILTAALDPAAAFHAHQAAAPAIVLTAALEPSAAFHAHQAESPVLIMTAALEPAAAFHAHQAQTITWPPTDRADLGRFVIVTAAAWPAAMALTFERSADLPTQTTIAAAAAQRLNFSAVTPTRLTIEAER